ncbi:hypothetical protein Bca52824_019037 [Brassica carinata]|uniref:PABC domain-containing protein n=1 Tax=Brassica carinata TaxID=52824 RepID=A0A8X7VS48_BRACI|nr:hypothetical protein Bca52824_019037 [Brassica carinata]
MIGETLYPLVELLEPTFAAKITGMLLELPQTEIFQCLKSSEAPNEKVHEAIFVLIDWLRKQINLDKQKAKNLRAALLLSKL